MVQHCLGIIDSDDGYVTHVYVSSQLLSRCTEGASEVITIRVRLDKPSRQISAFTDYGVVSRDGASNHVGENFRDSLVEREVVHILFFLEQEISPIIFQ